MGHAKRKHRLQTVADTRIDQEGDPLDDTAVAAILEAPADHGDADGNLSAGILYAMVGGTALWSIVGAIVYLLI